MRAGAAADGGNGSVCTRRTSVKVAKLGCGDGRGVSGVVVDDLEEEEGVDGVGGFGAASEDADFCAGFRLGNGVANIGLESGHGGGAGRTCVVNEHGWIEIAR